MQLDSSSSSRDWKYDVFLSFRGFDTRRNFVSYLHYCLELKGIRAFKDDIWLETGKSIHDEIFKAVEDSRFAVVIFSKNFASSRWCLDELAHIIKSKNELGVIVIPIFYDICPSYVRKQRGPFCESFHQHEERCRDDDDREKIQRWRDVLAETANLCGFDYQCFNSDAACIKKLINRMFPEPWKYDVYLSFRVEDTGRTFGSYLYDALVQNGIHTFNNVDKWTRKEISEESVKAIEWSKFAIVIFSKGYAASRCCLEELAHIMRCKNVLGRQTVIPIFYDVSPSEVGHQYTSFAESFSQREETCKDDDDTEKIQRWRDAFAEAGKISGHHLQNYKDDVDCIKKVVEFISPKSFKLFPFRNLSLSE